MFIGNLLEFGECWGREEICQIRTVSLFTEGMPTGVTEEEEGEDHLFGKT